MQNLTLHFPVKGITTDIFSELQHIKKHIFYNSFKQQ